MRNDVEKHAVEDSFVPGYPSLAALIASDPDHSTAIYRRFDRLSARNLLYLQAELAILEKKQDDFDKQDFNSDDTNVKDKARNWESLIARAESGTDNEAKERVELLKDIRKKLKEYRQCFEGFQTREDTKGNADIIVLQEKPLFSSLRSCLSGDLQNRPTRRSTTIFTTWTMARKHFPCLEGRVRPFMMTEVISWPWLGPSKIA